MNLFSKINKKITLLYKIYIIKDPFHIQASRWFRDKGDDQLRLNYNLNSESLVFDLGGYHGDFAAAIHEKFSCKVYIFEPVLEFYNICKLRFNGNNNIVCFNYGLSSSSGYLDINLAENASGFSPTPHSEKIERVEIRSIVDCIRSLNIKKIDLLKINIEGGEFDVLPAIIESNDINSIKYLQIQFHNFIENSEYLRNNIRKKLLTTHSEMWNYEFVWESWKLNSKNFN